MKKSLKTAFERAATVMGWDITSKVWNVNEEGKLRATVGATFIQRADTEKPFYRVVQIVNEGGAEGGIFSLDTFTSAELEALLRGIAYGAQNTPKA